MQIEQLAYRAIEARREDFERLALEIWSHPEIAFQEKTACRATAELAEKLGFEVQTPAYGIQTALRAVWGEGKPVIGFLGEYDALPGLSQQVCAEKNPVVPGGPGHGCGHNLIGVTQLAAAYGMKEAMRECGLPGTIVFYGCPAEEGGAGKVFMAREGAFRELDLAFTWHGGGTNIVLQGRCTGMCSVKYHFKGLTAHAGANPQDGRSALDAVELMNVGANYLREHVPGDVRIHYVITDGGLAPNIVPDTASTWYFIRAFENDTVEDVHQRIDNIARGAALMTGTEVEIEFINGQYGTMPNMVLSKVLDESMHEIPLPEWTQEELSFADALNKTSQNYEKLRKAGKLDSPLSVGIEPMMTESFYASTDVGDVMHICPCAELGTATSNFAADGHAWQDTASFGSTIGLKGMIYGANVLALAGLRLVQNPELVKAARAEFAESMHGEHYHCPIPEDVPIPQPDESV